MTLINDDKVEEVFGVITKDLLFSFFPGDRLV